MRQVDAPPRDRRPDRAHRGRGGDRRQDGPPGAARSRLRDGVPGGDADGLAHRREERLAAARDDGLGSRCPPRSRSRAARARRADGIREPLPLAAVRRHAAARRDRARAHVQAVADPDGRAVRRPRRDDARPPQPRAAPHLGGDEGDRRLRHPLDRRGGVPVVPRSSSCRRGPGACSRSSRSTSRYPRTNDTREETRFFELATEVRELLRESHEARETP